MSDFGSVESWIGRVLNDRYQIAEFVGEGASAVVFRGRHLDLARPVAIKLLRNSMQTPEQRKIDERRFLREAVFLGRVSSPHIAGAIDYGISEGVRYLVMEFVTGPSLADLAEQEGQLAPDRVAAIGYEIADGLAAVHGCGLVHRDLKPDNIVLVPGEGTNEKAEFVKILDFGLAKLVDDSATAERLTIDGSVCGTPHYMAPEQAVDEQVGPTADLYSLGVVMFELCAGRLPFDYDSMFLLMQAHVEEEAADVREFAPAAPAWLAELITDLLAKRPEDRPASAVEVRDRIGAAAMAGNASGKPLTQRQIRALSRKRKTTKPAAKGVGLWVAGLMGFALLVLTTLLLWPASEKPTGVAVGTSAPATKEQPHAKVNGGTLGTPAVSPQPKVATLTPEQALAKAQAGFLARTDIAHAMARRAADSKFAADALYQLIVKEPSNAHAHFYLALSQDTLEQPFDALGSFSSAIAADVRYREHKPLLDVAFGYLDQPLSAAVRPAAEKMLRKHDLLAGGKKYLEAMAGDPTRPDAAAHAKRLLAELSKR